MNITELDSYNLDDAVKFNDQLNPRLWDDREHLRPEVRERLLEIADDFREFLGVTDLAIRDITISGSNAAYTYTPNSDIDLHLVVDMPDNPVYRELFDAKKFQYNEQHDITIGGADVELYVQDADQPHISQGVYSILNNDWLQVPRRVKSVVDDTSTRNKFEKVGRQIERAIRSGSLTRMTRLAEKIKKMRQTGLENHGEFGPENLAFKLLRSQGLIKQLYDARNAAKDREFSLAEKTVKPKVTYGFRTPTVVEADTVSLEAAPAKLSDEEILRDFIDFCSKELELKSMPVVKLRKDPQWSVVNRTFGRYIDDYNLLEVAWGQRHIMDVLRTVAHELTHRHQHERESVPGDAGETGSPWENEANARAGVLMRDYAQQHPEYFAVDETEEVDESIKGATVAALSACIIGGGSLSGCATQQGMRPMDAARIIYNAKQYNSTVVRADVAQELNNFIRAQRGEVNAQNQSRLYQLQKQNQQQPPGPTNEGASGYIPTKAQAKDPRYSMALTVDIKPGQIGKEANKLNLKTNKQGIPQVAKANGLFEKLALELAQFKKGQADEDYSPDNPPGPEFKPTMPKGTVKVGVSDVYDWYKLGQHISNMKGLGKHDFGAGPPASIISFGDEDTEHKFIQDLKKTGLDVTDIDPVDPKQPKGMRKIKTDPTYNVAESVEMLDEVKMSPSALMKWATSPEAEGIRAGFEAELIFRDTTNNGDSDYEMEPDYDADERVGSISQIIEFFNNGEYGGLSSRQEARLQEQLDEAYYEWYDEQMQSDFKDEAEDLIRKVLVDEGDWDEDNEIQKQLALLDLSDDEINEVIKAGEAAPRFTKYSDQQAYAKENPLYQKYLDAQSEAEGLLDELVNDEVRTQGANWDAALDDFRDNYQIDDDSGFFNDVGLRWMSDVASEYSLDWPYMTGGGGNDGGRDWDDIGDSLQSVIDMPVKVSSGYHQATRREGQWIVEPDSSLSPDDREDYGLEIVSPPMPLLVALEKLQQVTDWANDPSEGNCYTNESTGLHMGVSVPYRGGDVDYLKLILFLGDEYVLQSFGREANTYTKSAMKSFRENIKSGRADPAGAMKLMQHGLLELAQREIQKGVGQSKYTSAHIQNGYIEFRSAGGDWLAEESADPEKLSSTMLRYARAMQIAADPATDRREYAKKLYKLIAPEGDSQLALFSQYASGELTAEQLKKKWAEKTIGNERKINQRWKLYNRATGEPVAGQEYNGFTEEEARARAKQKISPSSSDRDFDSAYELRNMSEDQQWEVYDVKTGETLEIVQGANKGAAADKVFDKYANQGVGFNVRPYVDPKTLTPRAKLAKRITTKKPEPKQVANQATNERGVPYWEIYSIKDDWNVIHTFLSDTAADAKVDGANWLTSTGVKYPDRFAVRPKIKTAQSLDDRQDSADLQARLREPVQDIQPDVAQNFGNQFSGQWKVVDGAGREVYRFRGVGNNQADANRIASTWARENSYTGALDVLPIMIESINPVSGAGAVPPRQDPKNTGKKTVTPAEKVFKNPVQGQPYRSAIGQAISKKDLENMTQQIQVARKLGDSVMEMEDTPPEVLRALNQAAQKSGYRNWADVKANPRSNSAVMTVAKLANTILKTTGPHHEKLFYKNKTDVDENFADGKGPGRPGDSQRHGIPKGATMAQLEKAAKAPGRKGQLARWQINMRRGKKK
jgi:hypothetical protein